MSESQLKAWLLHSVPSKAEHCDSKCLLFLKTHSQTVAGGCVLCVVCGVVWCVCCGVCVVCGGVCLCGCVCVCVYVWERPFQWSSSTIKSLRYPFWIHPTGLM